MMTKTTFLSKPQTNQELAGNPATQALALSFDQKQQLIKYIQILARIDQRLQKSHEQKNPK